MQTSETGIRRSRLLYAFAVLGTIALGLLSRRFPVLGQYPGDVLWSLMVFLALGFLFPRARGVSIAVACGLIAGGIEFLKLNQTPWLVAARRSTLGHLVFGHVFSWQNLLAYAGGILIGFTLDRWTRQCRSNTFKW